MAAQKSTSPEQRIQTSIAEVWRAANGVIHILFTSDGTHSLPEAKEIVAAHNALAEGRPRPVLADIRGVQQGANLAARKYYVSDESARYKSGMAMLIRSPLQRMLGNIFFKLNRPPYPSRLFSDEEDAMAWLLSLGNA